MKPNIVEQPRRSSQKDDRFMPCLLNRLIDNEPQNRIDHQVQVLTLEQLKVSIIKNLELALSSSFQIPASEFHCPEVVRNSILFFIMPSFVGRTKNQNMIEELRREILHQIRCFEPRIDGDSLEITIRENPEYRDEFSLAVSGNIVVGTINERILYEREITLNAGTLSVLPQKQKEINHG